MTERLVHRDICLPESLDLKLSRAAALSGVGANAVIHDILEQRLDSIIAQAEQKKDVHDIPWADSSLRLKRVVIANKQFDLVELRELLSLLLCLRIEMVWYFDELRPVAGDLWLGCSPNRGWENLAGECGMARTVELPVVLQKLKKLEL